MKKEKVDTTLKIPERPQKKLSIFRIILVLFILALVIYRVDLKRRTNTEIASIIDFDPWFASYVDVTAIPLYGFEQLGTDKESNVVLSFIVSSESDACSPTWGTYYTLDEAAVSLDMDRRIARLRQQGGEIAVSFGGAKNDEIALGCTDPERLLEAYLSVISRYNIDTIDLDLEGEGLNNLEAGERRAEAIAQLQQQMRTEGGNLAVWLTLPVVPQGLTKEGTDAISIMLDKGVDISGVNVMTMNYGNSKDKNDSMLEASISALREVHRQLGILYTQKDINLSSRTLWRKIGATPMIGQNDFVNEVFTLEDAEGLNEFALDQRIGRISMWSANRDTPCGENYVDVKVVSNSCSGVNAPKYSFTKILSNGFEGEISQNALIQTENDLETVDVIIDDPENSPYQIWQETGAYPRGVKVVWRGNVYEAKWWTKNDLPDNPVLQSWETPWQLIGPVLPGESPVRQATLPEGTYPKWSGTVEYEGGELVLFEGIPFQAKWWNQGQSPAASAANIDSSPWLPLSQKQIMEILAELEN